MTENDQEYNVPDAVFADGILDNVSAGLRSLVRNYWSCFRQVCFVKQKY
jgi:hypothetical protein